MRAKTRARRRGGASTTEAERPGAGSEKAATRPGTPVFAQKTEVADIIRARSFELVDKDGKLRAGLGLDDGEPVLALGDKNGVARSTLALVNGEPGLTLTDKNGKIIWSEP